MTLKGCERTFHTFPSYIPWVQEFFSLACGGLPRFPPTHLWPKLLHRIRKLCVESLLRSEFFGRSLLAFWLGVLTVCMREKSTFLLVVPTYVLPERPTFLFMFTNTFLQSIEKGLFLIFNLTNFIRF